MAALDTYILHALHMTVQHRNVHSSRLQRRLVSSDLSLAQSGLHVPIDLNLLAQRSRRLAAQYG